jgi:hypothetical protein
MPPFPSFANTKTEIVNSDIRLHSLLLEAGLLCENQEVPGTPISVTIVKTSDIGKETANCENCEACKYRQSESRISALVIIMLTLALILHITIIILRTM